MIFGALLWLGALALPALSLRRRGRRVRWARLAAGLVFPLAASLLFFALVPFWGEHRLLFPIYYALWLGAAGTLAALARLRRGAGGLPVKLGLAAALVAVLWSLGVWASGWFWLCLAAAAALALALRRWRRLARCWLVLPAAACLAALLLGPLWYPSYRAAREERRNRLYARYYGAQGSAWQVVSRAGAGSGGVTVAYSGSPLIFPLFGPRLQNRVVYVPLSPEDRPGPVALWRGDSLRLRLAEARRGKFDEGYWLAGLKERRVDFLLLVDDPQVGGVAAETGAALARPEVFALELEGENVRLFRVRRPGAAEAAAPVRAP